MGTWAGPSAVGWSRCINGCGNPVTGYEFVDDRERRTKTDPTFERPGLRPTLSYGIRPLCFWWPPVPRSSQMKRILVALVLGLGVLSAVGCGSGSPTKAGDTKK